jgi:hypothetical protein
LPSGAEHFQLQAFGPVSDQLRQSQRSAVEIEKSRKQGQL